MQKRSVLAFVLIVSSVGWLGWYAFNAYSWYRLVGAFGGNVQIGLSSDPMDHIPVATALTALALGIGLIWPRAISRHTNTE